MCILFGEGLERGWCSHLGPENDCLLRLTASSRWNAAGGDCQARGEGRASLALLQGGHLNLSTLQFKGRKAERAAVAGSLAGVRTGDKILGHLIGHKCAKCPLPRFCAGELGARRGGNMGKSPLINQAGFS